MKYSKWIVAKILAIKFISHGVRSYSASCIKQNAAFLMENLSFCAPGWREFQSSCQEDRWFDGWIRVLMGRAFSPHIPPRQVTLGRVSDNHYTHHWTINHPFLLLVICQLGENDGRPTEHITWTSSGIGQILTPLDEKWKVGECVDVHLNTFVWELSYISDPLQLSSPFSWHSQVAKFKMEDKYLRRALLWNLENWHTPSMPFTPKLHKNQFGISYKFQ